MKGKKKRKNLQKNNKLKIFENTENVSSIYG